MKIILNHDVKNLGEEGDVCDVARGYARNYLLPQGLALPYTKKYIAIIESRRSAIEKRKAEKRAEAATLKEKLDGVVIDMPVSAGDTGKLYGSVTAAMVSEALEAQGITIEKKKIELSAQTIRMTGEYAVLIKLYAQETATISLKVFDPAIEAKKAAAAAKAAEAAERAAARTKTTEEVVEETEEVAEEVEAVEAVETEAVETVEAVETEAAEETQAEA